MALRRVRRKGRFIHTNGIRGYWWSAVPPGDTREPCRTFRRSLEGESDGSTARMVSSCTAAASAVWHDKRMDYDETKKPVRDPAKRSRSNSRGTVSRPATTRPRATRTTTYRERWPVRKSSRGYLQCQQAFETTRRQRSPRARVFVAPDDPIVGSSTVQRTALRRWEQRSPLTGDTRPSVLRPRPRGLGSAG